MVSKIVPEKDTMKKKKKQIIPVQSQNRHKKRGRERSELETLPGVGRAIAEDLESLGIHTLDQLADSDPEILFRNLERIRNTQIDRCVLYVFRCAVYCACEDYPDPNKMKWWNWKDENEK